MSYLKAHLHAAVWHNLEANPAILGGTKYGTEA